MNKVYSVKITETLSKIVEVDAESAEAAEEIVKTAWNNSEYILDAESFKGVDFKVTEKDKQKEDVQLSMENMYRYSIESGVVGGIIFTDSISNARIVLSKKYGADFELEDGAVFDEDSLKVWEWEKDGYKDDEYVNVIECYGN